MDLMCALHDSDEYGVLRWTLKDISTAIGAPIKLLNELVAKAVLKGSDKELIVEFVYIPRSGRKEGDPVTLVGKQKGPIWFSSRMVKDEYIRTIRGDNSRFGASPEVSPKGGIGEPESDGSSTSSPSSSPPSGVRERMPTLALASSPTARQTTESDFADSMPTATAKAFDDLKAFINSLHRKWTQRPHFTAQELRDLRANARVWFDLSDGDRKLLKVYMGVLIPEDWITQRCPKFWQPDSRARLITNVIDVLGHADRWKTECKRRGISTGLEAA